MQLEDEKGCKLVDEKRSDLEAKLSEVREGLSARKVISGAKTKLQTDSEEL